LHRAARLERRHENQPSFAAFEKFLSSFRRFHPPRRTRDSFDQQQPVPLRVMHDIGIFADVQS